jgi:tetratricopeptide (TPR) repeat protein
VMRDTFTRRVVPLLGLLGLLSIGTSCTGTDRDERPADTALDTRLVTHAVLPGEPSVAGLAYVQAIAEAHRQADRSSESAATLALLMTALERTPPAGDGTAELLHFELLARTGELLLAQHDPERASQLLAPHLGTERSLPIDRASARCLVALGDAATQTGDHAQAMSSYARALEMLTLLLEEVES